MLQDGTTMEAARWQQREEESACSVCEALRIQRVQQWAPHSAALGRGGPGPRQQRRGRHQQRACGAARGRCCSGSGAGGAAGQLLHAHHEAAAGLWLRALLLLGGRRGPLHPLRRGCVPSVSWQDVTALAALHCWTQLRMSGCEAASRQLDVLTGGLLAHVVLFLRCSVHHCAGQLGEGRAAGQARQGLPGPSCTFGTACVGSDAAYTTSYCALGFTSFPTHAMPTSRISHDDWLREIHAATLGSAVRMSEPLHECRVGGPG